MSRPRRFPTGRRALCGMALVMPLVLAGCGWTPLYADPQTGPAGAALRAIHVAPISERIGQKLELALRASLNPSGESTPQIYILRTELHVARIDLGILTQGVGTRGRIEVNATCVLSDIKTGATVHVISTHVAESFDILANEYSNTVAEDDARTRAVEELRRDIVDRLTVFLQRRIATEAHKP